MTRKARDGEVSEESVGKTAARASGFSVERLLKGLYAYVGSGSSCTPSEELETALFDKWFAPTGQ